jgi:hypothetical protein
MQVNAKTTTVHVYCVKPKDATSWYWLADGAYKVDAQQHYYMYKNKIYSGYTVSFPNYIKALHACIVDWLPQPAYSRISSWTNFIIETPRGFMLAPGFLDSNIWVPRLTAPSEDFKPDYKCEKYSLMAHYSLEQSCKFFYNPTQIRLG